VFNDCAFVVSVFVIGVIGEICGQKYFFNFQITSLLCVTKLCRFHRAEGLKTTANQ